MFHFMLSPFGLGVLAVAGGTLFYKRYGKTGKAKDAVSGIATKGASLLGLTLERAESEEETKKARSKAK